MSKKKSAPERNATHMLRYLFQIEQSIRNGEYPNANKLNEKLRTNFSRSTFGRYNHHRLRPYKQRSPFYFGPNHNNGRRSF